MSMPRILIKKLRDDAEIPQYKKDGDSGFDLRSMEEVEIKPHSCGVLPTGLAFCIPEGFEMQIRMRSGAAMNLPLILANAPGTIDSGYRGEVKILARSLSDTTQTIKKGERIAQGVIMPVIRVEFVEAENLPPSERGSNGFGSTGHN